MIVARLTGGPAHGQRHRLPDLPSWPLRVALPVPFDVATFRPGDALPVTAPELRVALCQPSLGILRWLDSYRAMTPAERLQRGDEPEVPVDFLLIEGEPRYPATLTGGPWDGRTVDLGRPPREVALYRARLGADRIAWYAPRWTWLGGPEPEAWQYIGTDGAGR